MRAIGCWMLVCLLPATSAPAAERSVDTALLNSARAAAKQGRFLAAEQMLRTKIADSKAPVTDPYAKQLEILRRTRLEYSLTEAALLKKIRPSIPDVTRKDLAKWRAEGVLQFREIDGQIWYFASEPRNLFRFCSAAQKRRTDTNTCPTRKIRMRRCHTPVEPFPRSFLRTCRVTRPPYPAMSLRWRWWR